jgi:hypothetical protein
MRTLVRPTPTAHKLTTALIALVIAAFGVIAAPTAAQAAGSVTLYRYYSLESNNYPGYFARHQNFLGELTKVASALDFADATWMVVPGLAGSGVSLRSKNYPSYYLRHASWRLQISQSDGSQLFREDATFHLRAGNASSASAWTSFESYNYPGYYVRHAGYHLWLNANDGSPLFAADSTWAVEPPLG